MAFAKSRPCTLLKCSSKSPRMTTFGGQYGHEAVEDGEASDAGRYCRIGLVSGMEVKGTATDWVDSLTDPGLRLSIFTLTISSPIFAAVVTGVLIF